MAAWTETFLPGGLNWYDVVVLLAVLYGLYSGIRNGLAAELITALGLVLMVAAAIGFYDLIGRWLQGRTGWDIELANLVAFVGIAVAVFSLTFAVKIIVHRKRKATVFSAVAENVGGALAGVVRMLLLMAWLTVMLCLVRSPFWHDQIARQSRFGAWLVDRLPAVAAVADQQFPETVPFFRSIERRAEPTVDQSDTEK